MVNEFNKDFDEHGVTVAHHMPGSDGVYMKEVFIPKGKELFNHKHSFTHKSLLASGTARVTAGDAEPSIVVGPAVLLIESGIQHSVVALTDIVWFCVHATSETDPDQIDHALVTKGKSCH